MATVAEQLARSLREVGTRYLFGVPSGGWIDYMEAIRELDELEFILVGHEGPGAVMADVCGRLTGAPGACFGTFGPGATNLATGVGGALLDRSPLLAFTDEMPDHLLDRRVQMNIDHQALFRPLTKLTARLEADRVSEMVVEAARFATAEPPGPVHIGLPLGMASLDGVGEDARFHPAGAPPAPSPAVLERVEELFTGARNPLLAVGLTATRFDVRSLIMKVAGEHRMPVVLTPMAKGMVPEDHPAYSGVLFHALSDEVAATHREADLVIAIGYDPVEFSYEEWLPEAPLVHIDTSPADIDTSAHDLACDVVGDIKVALERLASIRTPGFDWDLDALAERRRVMFARLAPVPGVFGPRAALAILREILPGEGIMVCDVGAHTHLIGQMWPTPAPDRQLMTNGWSSMGFGIPAAIGARLSRPDQPVCAVVGDGGFLMSAGELDVAKRLNLNVVFVILTDRSLSLIRIKQERKGHAVHGTPIRSGDHRLGESFLGVPVYGAADPDAYRSALIDAFDTDGPAIVEALIDGSEYDDLVLKRNR
ncbi:thiamine pyrophosphate-binding protein [Gemmatimonadota bacterium]